MSYASSPPPAPVSRPPEPHPASRHLTALIVGCLLILPGLALLFGGAGLGITYAVSRDSAGYLSLTLPVLSSSSPAITVEDAVLETGPDVPSWVLDRLDIDVRLTARFQPAGQAVFIGIPPAERVDAYLGGVTHDQVIGLSARRNGADRTAV